jgi:putative Mg2+ transporter-C (MgtC) family protein
MDFLNFSSLNNELNMALRLLAAYLFSAIIGFERERAHRPAGLRTHILVGVGATAFMLISIYGFDGLETVRDPARLAAQVVTGIGFIGAGAIWRSDNSVGGLTTAASIWITAAVGMMVGVGMYFMALLVTIMAWFTLRWLKPANHRRVPHVKNKRYGEPSLIRDADDPDDFN